MQSINCTVEFRDKKTVYVLQEDTVINGMLIPKGFPSDGHSVPWFLRWIVSNHSLPIAAAFYHDYGYIVNPLKQTRKEVDREYHKIMRKHYKVFWYVAGSAFTGVRLGSWPWWSKRK